ncbi:MAG TPA: ubiquitin-conjugating enzyme E2 [Allocoleopsis sp.]
MSNLAIKRISKEIANFEKKNFKFENFYLAFNPDNLLEWYFLLYNLDSPYNGGMYLGSLTLSKDYPFKPPVIKMITPSGRFHPNTSICTTFTVFHGETYSPVWRIDTMISAFISFMLDPNDQYGIGSISTDQNTKKILAKKSKEFNESNKIFVKYFKQMIS